MASDLTLQDIQAAAQRLRGEVVDTPCLVSRTLSELAGCEVYLKFENLQFTASFNGKEIMRADWHPAVSANPYQSFFVRVPETGTFLFQWFDDDGSVYKAEQKVQVA